MRSAAQHNSYAAFVLRDVIVKVLNTACHFTAAQCLRNSLQTPRVDFAAPVLDSEEVQ